MKKQKKYLKADEEKIYELIRILKCTIIKENLTNEELEDFCNKMVFGKYGKIFGIILYNLDQARDVKNSIECKKLIDIFINKGYINEKEYLNLFGYYKKISKNNPFIYNTNELEIAIKKEIEEANLGKISVSDFLESGGTLSEIIPIFQDRFIKEISLNSEINNIRLKPIEYEVDIYEIIFLVSILNTLDISKETKTELLKTYYECLEEGKKDGFIKTKITIKKRPNLYSLLLENKQLQQFREIKNKKLIKK